MTDLREVVQECYDTAAETGLTTREVAVQMVASMDRALVDELAAEFIVAQVARAARMRTLEAERAAERAKSAAESPTPVTPAGRIPRKGSRERAAWERDTPEGQAWARAEDEAWTRETELMFGALGKALERYAEDLRIQWTADLLDSTFNLPDGSLVAWGDATVEQHADRRQMFLNNAHANLEGAARHEVALRELRETGKATLREMVAVAA